MNNTISGYFRLWSEYDHNVLVDSDIDTFDDGFDCSACCKLYDFWEEIKEELAMLLDETRKEDLDGKYETYGKVTLVWYRCGNPLDGEDWDMDIVISDEQTMKIGEEGYTKRDEIDQLTKEITNA